MYTKETQMKASETNFQPIIEGTKQYVVPLFQRAYSWGKKQWGDLWNDLMSLCESEEPKYHFIGSIVTMPITSVPQGVSKYLLIDGQQRLTTIFILMTLLRDRAQEDSIRGLPDKIQERMLVNKFEAGNDYFKLLPTQIDRAAFQRLVMQEQQDPESTLTQCYAYFKRELSRQPASMLDILASVITSRLSVVSIVLDPDDNPHLVFESLNAKGKQLTQADLIRNHFFMRVHVDQQESIYHTYWEPMQLALDENLSEFIRHYLMRDGVFIRQGDIYYVLKGRVRDMDILGELKKLAVFATYYQHISSPETEPDQQIRHRLTRLNRLDVTTTYPFLLNCYDDYAQGILSQQDFVQVLKILENFVVRRFVCGVPTSQYNKLFPSIYAWVHENHPTDFVAGLCATLQNRDYPRDSEFKQRLVETRLYGSGERREKTRFILETLETSYGHKEVVPTTNLTIEHVLPQTLSDWWRHHLGDEAEQEHELLVHTLGNLTLTAYNSELSNASFTEKQQLFGDSHLELNKYFAGLVEWTRESIEMRSEHLAEQALTIWPYFGSSQSSYMPTSARTATGKTPKTLILLGERISVDSWRDVHARTMGMLSELEPDTFQQLAVDYPRLISTEPTKMKKSTQLSNGMYVELNLSARRVYQFCTQAIEYAGLPVDSWQVETV
jgi:uncharacterized protein with ParB-like and HNH nuclease domain